MLKYKKCIDESNNAFAPEVITRASKAAAPEALAAWVLANLKYSEVLVTIGPLEKEFNQANSALKDNQNRLKATQDELKVLDDEVKELK